MKSFPSLLVATLLPCTAQANEFKEPFPVKVGEAELRTESPGYASPTMADLDGDGLADLVVGQFKGGKMVFLKNTGKKGAPAFAEKGWIQGETEAAPAEVPGVW